uniref:Uncharacterized protein n=1 Tax=Brassica oleracea TaxID=3712 RepID=A0A3P6B0W5_BRAOL|nr:unnamed protein product [Brassica oleracea]
MRIPVKSPSTKSAAPEKTIKISPLPYPWTTVAMPYLISTLSRSITAARARSSLSTGRRRHQE